MTGGGRHHGPVLLTARWVVGHDAGRHVLLERGEVVFEGNTITFAGHDYPGAVAKRIDYGNALVGPGFIDLDALGDLDTTILGFDNQPAWRKGRVWPESYLKAGPFEMYSAEELVFQKRYAFAELIRNGITTALPIASLFYRAWGETVAEFEAAAEVAVDLGLRVYLGPAYRAGNSFVREDGRLDLQFDEARGLKGLADAISFCRRNEGLAGGLVRTMLAPDRLETCTSELLRRTAAAGADLDVPVRQHSCQSRFEYDSVVRLHGLSPPEWMASLGYLSPRTLLPHGTFVSGSSRVAGPGRDLEIIRDAGSTIVHCPLVSSRHGNVIESFRHYRDMGINIGLGTDTSPPDMVLNMQLGLILARVIEGNAEAVRCEQYYDAATLAGATALRRPDLGRLAAGAKADLTVFDLARPDLGQVIDPIQTMMIAGRGRHFSTVIIDGRFVMQNGYIPGADQAADAVRAQAQFERLMALYPRRTFGHPPVEQIFSHAYPVRRRGA